MAKRFALSKTDWSKILTGAIVAVLGALLTYVTNLIPQLNIPAEWLPSVTAGWAVIVNVVRKFITNNK
jgi:hypothetical protein